MRGRPRLLVVVGWTFLAAGTLLPLVAVAIQAFARQWFFPDLVPADWTVAGLRSAVGRDDTRRAITDSLVVAAAVTSLALAVAVPAARALVLGHTRLGRVALLAFFVPIALPPVALAMGLEVAFLRGGADGGRLPVIVAHLAVALPYAVLLLAAALARYDIEYERQALVLGATRLRVLTLVFAPLAAPGIAVAGAVTFVVSWSQYLLTLLPGGGRVVTLPVLLLAAAGGGDPTFAAAIAVVAAVPPAIAVVAVVRHLTPDREAIAP